MSGAHAGFSCVLLVLLVSACLEPSAPREAGPVEPFTGGIRIAWDHDTLQRPFDGPAWYPRMIRLEDGALLLSVESRGASYVMRSEDDGATWGSPVRVAEERDGIMAAVPSLLQLRGGTVLLAYNPRPPQTNADPGRRFGIGLAASADGGRTWEPRATVFEGGHEWSRGVWEPAMLELPDGEILLFVANEYPYATSLEQEISVLRSRDEGRSWSDPETVSFRAGHRDGMPVPIQLRDGSGIVIAIEDNGLVAGPFKPVIVRIPADGVLQGVVRGDSPQRWSALRDEDRLPDHAYGGAPYLVQFPDGETLLSYQGNEGRRGDWSVSTMVVALGDGRARSFSRKSEPFRIPDGRSALWNSLFLKDDTTVTALTSTNGYSGSIHELYLVDGHRVPEPRAPAGGVRVDGSGSEAVWDRSPVGRIGAYGPTFARFRTAWDPEHFYARFEVERAGLGSTRESIVLYLAPGPLQRDAPVAGAFRLWVGEDGGTVLEEGRDGRWVRRPAPGVVAAASPAASGPRGTRTTVEVGVPWGLVGGRPATSRGWGMTVELVAEDGHGSLIREAVSGTNPDRPGSWLRIELQE
jgi:hypothetical protein